MCITHAILRQVENVTCNEWVDSGHHKNLRQTKHATGSTNYLSCKDLPDTTTILRSAILTAETWPNVSRKKRRRTTKNKTYAVFQPVSRLLNPQDQCPSWEQTATIHGLCIVKDASQSYLMWYPFNIRAPEPGFTSRIGDWPWSKLVRVKSLVDERLFFEVDVILTFWRSALL